MFIFLQGQCLINVGGDVVVATPNSTAVDFMNLNKL